MFALVLHAHQPHVRHPERSKGHHEEGWLFEAFVESYLPLADMIARLLEAAVPCRLSLSLSPTLLEMLRDSLLQERFRQHLGLMVELGEREIQRLEGGPFEQSARLVRTRFERAYGFVSEGRDLVMELKALSQAGTVELLTGPATHAYLPLLTPASVCAQLQVARACFEGHLGQSPRGLWLPQFGYAEGLDRAIASQGFEYVVLASSALVRAKPRPRYATYRPVRSPAQLACFARDVETTAWVHGPGGYPADPYYRDFFRDIGWDLDEGYLAPFFPVPLRRFTGYKHHRITGPTDHKEPYEPAAGHGRARAHAEHYVTSVSRQLRWLGEQMDRPPLLVAAHDAELLGHRWAEGILWLEHVFRAFQETGVELLTLSEAVERCGPLQECSPATSSALDGGYSRPLVGESNQWIYRHIHQASHDMERLVAQVGESDLERRALRQAGRELLLAEASDWATMMSSWTYPEYARNRVTEHILEFCRLREEMSRGLIQEAPLQRAENRHSLFATLEPSFWESLDE